MTAPDEGQSDFSPEVLGPAEADITRPIAGGKYNPEPRRENIRGVLALGAFILFTMVIGVILISVAFGHRTWSDMEGVTAAVLPAVTTVVGSTVGFYFGARGQDGKR